MGVCWFALAAAGASRVLAGGRTGACELGGPVNGHHTYNRFNPNAGLTYRLASWVQVYGSYSEANRAPTPLELSCASAANPCSLLNFFVGDPNLNQIVARTAEAGARGKLADAMGGQFDWNVDVYHTENTNDIISMSKTCPSVRCVIFTLVARSRAMQPCRSRFGGWIDKRMGIRILERAAWKGCAGSESLADSKVEFLHEIGLFKL